MTDTSLDSTTSLSLPELRVISVVSILLCGLSGGLLPLCASPGSSWLSYGNAFGGGVFLGAGLVHMLPEASKDLQEALLSMEAGGKEGLAEFPWASVFAGLGLFLVLALDRCFVAWYMATSGGSPKTRGYARVAVGGPEETGEAPDSPTGQSPSPFAETPVSEIDISARAREVSRLYPGEAVGGEGQETDGVKRSSSSLVLLIVLSVHSLSAGVALGLEKSVGSVTAVLLAICVHKVVAAVALGSALRNAERRVSIFSLKIVLFSVSTPIGIGVGVLISRLLGVYKSSGAFGATLADSKFQSVQAPPSDARGGKVKWCCEVKPQAVGGAEELRGVWCDTGRFQVSECTGSSVGCTGRESEVVL
uniref:Zinc/iron permease n=1 Tax=Chromera velia CCMP2878 TaxID=1169474 RepID=A0A0G4I9K0_9ALVE|eukprot:Cvel_12297.t1-p1 / transcript=Cvel_12297.t1 / gene=Cvel_12297 / organism=Chromera_velia_CCMP2878 / gene_product=Uncharacterized protein PB18E9.04c, putative / transcript_product=Uncharacterized protein PB18E9.04c, putative / location=Cvel_scaffold798:42858-47324(-) / protein_length=362 / sequence_SO=supercontig / SO=protein_coding / is_pseudo=false